MATIADLRVACVLRSGGIYTAEHVAALQRQVEHFMPGVRFACLSDVAVPCERVALTRDWPGWWAKLALFDHFRGPTLYLDLDSTLLDEPSALLGGRFRMIRNWADADLMASGVMYWDGDYAHITRAFEPVAAEVMATYVTCAQWGDQAFIAEHAEPEAFPPGIESWLYSLQPTGVPPPGTKIVAFNNNYPPWRGPRWARRWYERGAA